MCLALVYVLFIAGKVVEGVDGQEIKDISPLGLCLLLHHQQFLQERPLLVLQTPDRTAETFFSKNCFSQHSHHWYCLINWQVFN